MFVLRRTTFRAVSSASHALLSSPRAARSLTTRATVPFRHPSVPSPFLQRRSVSDDASKEAAASEETAGDVAVPSEEAAATSEETTVTIEEAVPVSEEAVPVSEEAVPVSEESAPAPEEAAPAVAAPAPAKVFAPTARPEGASSTVLYAGNLYYDVTPENLKDHFSAIGPVKRANLVRDPRGQSKGFGFVEFENSEDAITAIERFDQTILSGRRMTVQWHIPRTTGRTPRQPGQPSTTLFVGNMPFKMSDKELNQLFRQVHNVVAVRVAIDRRTGQPRGFAHADFTDVESATEAKEFLSGLEIHNRKLVTDYAVSTRHDLNTSEGQ